MTPISVISSRKSLQVKRGRPKLYDGKIEMEHLEEDRFEIVNLENGQGRILSAVVHSRSLNRNNTVVHSLFVL